VFKIVLDNEIKVSSNEFGIEDFGGARYRVNTLLIYTIQIKWVGRVYLLMTMEPIIIINFGDDY
jgi:hypothetical protein